MKIMSDLKCCPACGSEDLEPVRRSGRENWILDQSYVCKNCLERVGRVPSGDSMLLAKMMVALKLI